MMEDTHLASVAGLSSARVGLKLLLYPLTVYFRIFWFTFQSLLWRTAVSCRGALLSLVLHAGPPQPRLPRSLLQVNTWVRFILSRSAHGIPQLMAHLKSPRSCDSRCGQGCSDEAPIYQVEPTISAGRNIRHGPSLLALAPWHVALCRCLVIVKTAISVYSETGTIRILKHHLTPRSKWSKGIMDRFYPIETDHEEIG